MFLLFYRFYILLLVCFLERCFDLLYVIRAYVGIRLVLVLIRVRIQRATCLFACLFLLFCGWRIALFRNISRFLCRDNVRCMLFLLFIGARISFVVLSNVVIRIILLLTLLDNVQIRVRWGMVSDLPALFYWSRKAVLVVLVVYVGVLLSHRVRVFVGLFTVFLLSHLTLLDNKLSVRSRFLYDVLYQLVVCLILV